MISVYSDTAAESLHRELSCGIQQLPGIDQVAGLIRSYLHLSVEEEANRFVHLFRHLKGLLIFWPRGLNCIQSFLLGLVLGEVLGHLLPEATGTNL